MGTAWASPPGEAEPPSPLPFSSPSPSPSPPLSSHEVRPAAPVAATRRALSPPGWVLPPGEDQSAEASWDRMTRLGLSPGADAPFPDASDDFDAGDPPLSAAGAFGGSAPDGSPGRRIGLRAFDPGRRGVKALAAVAILVVVVAAFLAWRARPRVDAVPSPSFDVAGSTSEPDAPVGSAGGSGPAEVVVAVAGKVRKPGLVRLATGARVADALTAAGGSDPGVDVAMLNLARKVVDGELILVGVTPSPGQPVATGPAPAVPGGAPAGGPVNLNTATLADLDGLPGVGPVLAQRILDARDAQGGFKSVGDLRKVNGIGDARFEQLKDLVTV